MAKTLLEQIEADALDSNKSVADALRKCVALGGRSSNDDLRRWASQELRGYDKPDDVPEYRIIAAPIVIDGIVPGGIVERETISVHDLPDVAQKAGIDEILRLTSGVGELEEMSRRAADSNEAVRIGLPDAGTLAKLMTYELQAPGRAVQRVYWNASPTAVFGVVDQVRTRLVELVAQIRADTGTSVDPPPDAVQNAVNVVFYGKASRVTVNTAQSTGSGRVSVNERASDQSFPWWRTTKALWGFVVGVATIAAAVIAYLQLA